MHFGFIISGENDIDKKELHLNCRQPRYIAWCNQFICTCHHVRLLFFDIVSTRTEKLAVVEKAYHTSSIGKQYSGVFFSCVYSQLSPLIPIWNANNFLHVQKLMLFFQFMHGNFNVISLFLLCNCRFSSVYWSFTFWIQFCSSNADGQRRFRSSVSFRICSCSFYFWTFTSKPTYGSPKRNSINEQAEIHNALYSISS